MLTTRTDPIRHRMCLSWVFGYRPHMATSRFCGDGSTLTPPEGQVAHKPQAFGYKHAILSSSINRRAVAKLRFPSWPLQCAVLDPPLYFWTITSTNDHDIGFLASARVHSSGVQGAFRRQVLLACVSGTIVPCASLVMHTRQSNVLY